MSQTRRDLDKHIHAKLFQWVEDSINLYQMADLHHRTAQQDIFASLMQVLAAMALVNHIPEEIVTNLFKEYVEALRKRHEISND